MRVAWLACLAGALACAGAPPIDATRGTVWGYVRLVPKQGVGSPEGAYADRRVRDAVRVDYAHPGFAVVYAPSSQAPRAARAQSMSLESAPGGIRFVPAHAAIGIGDSLEIANHTTDSQIISAPDANWLRQLGPGERAVLSNPSAGELAIHALGRATAPAVIWVAPGAYAIADASGRYELSGIAPGVSELRAWHPRLPPSAPLHVMVEAGASARLDIEIGVDRREGSAQ